MNRSRRRAVTGVGAVVCTAATLLAAESPETRFVADWTQRLEQLRPQEPARYLELAEEVADAASTPGPIGVELRPGCLCL